MVHILPGPGTGVEDIALDLCNLDLQPLDLVASTEIGAEADRIAAIALRRDVGPRGLLHGKPRMRVWAEQTAFELKDSLKRKGYR